MLGIKFIPSLIGEFDIPIRNLLENLLKNIFPYGKISIRWRGGEVEQKKLVREIKREALARMEEAARTENDFHAVSDMWDKLDANWERNQRYHGLVYLADVNWVLIKRGNYLDIIFDRAEEMHQLIEDFDISKLVEALREKPKEVLYLSAIRFYTIQQIALVRGCTDRNVLKMKTKMLDGLRKSLSEKLHIRIENGGVITTSQRYFLEKYSKTESEEGDENGV